MKFAGQYFAIILLTGVSCNESKTETSELIGNKLKRKPVGPIDLADISYPSLWVYGGPPSPKDHQRQIVDDLYHFRFVIKSSSCTVLPEVGADQHNQTTDSIMTARFGKYWQQRFEYSVDSLYTLDSLAIAIVKSDKYVLELQKKLGTYNEKHDFYPGLEYNAYATFNDDIKLVTLEGRGVVKNSVKTFNYFRGTVDIRRKKVVFSDKTAFVIY